MRVWPQLHSEKVVEIPEEYKKLLDHEDPWDIDPEDFHELQYDAFKEWFDFHYENCDPYNEYCNKQGVTPDSIEGYEDIGDIPSIPSDIFRNPDKLLTTIPEEDVEMILTSSSTTSDNPSRYGFSGEDVNIMVKSTSRIFEEMLGMDGKGKVFFLTPPPSDTDTGMVNGTDVTLRGMGYTDEDIDYLVEGSNLDAEETVEKIKAAAEENKVYTYGPPFTYRNIIEYCESEDLSLELGDEDKVLSTGGWKGVEGKISREEFVDRLTDVFSIRNDQYRDAYGLTDIATAMFECENHNYHVPPWMYASPRDPDNLEREVEEGEEGLISLKNATIFSYPAATFPGDMAVVTEGCECGRSGQTVEHRGRAQEDDQRGCAIKLEEFMESISE